MKRIMISVLLLSMTMVVKAGDGITPADDGITFVVDKNLSVVRDKREYSHTKYLDDDDIFATSLTDEQNLKDLGKDAFYQCIISAYANHQSVTLSPDMIWLLISQGFSRYVNAHAEQLRPMIVSHYGKKELAVESFKDLLKEKGDWNLIIDSFASEIGQHTKDNIADIMTADFSTTAPSERIVSQITLMESLKSYFDYAVFYAGCGIPSIQLKGTPDDWRHVLDKTMALERYGLGTWVNQLRPILLEFVKASEGHPQRKFWQQMVKKKQVRRFKGGLCNPKKPTIIDGWILTFFPDGDGIVPGNTPFTRNMPSDLVYVGFEYRIVEPQTKKVLSKQSMELWAGFLGIDEDRVQNMLTPVIGWYVRLAPDPSESVPQF